MMEEQISKIDKKREVIETIFDAYAASGQSWDEYRRGKSGIFHVYSLEQLIEEKRQLREQNLKEEIRQLREENNLLLAKTASSAGKISHLVQCLLSISCVSYYYCLFEKNK